MKVFTRKKIEFDEVAIRECKNCGQNFNGRFCNRCGEKVIEQEERTIKFFLGHVLNAFTFIDGKFWRSFKTMLLSPGKMTFDLVE
nr:hypothetical protein [Chryseolinea sp.]